MKKSIVATVLVAIIMLSGCLSALHPLFTEKDLVFDPKLVGTWQQEGDNEAYVFEKGTPQSFSALPEGLQKLASKSYLVTITNRKTGEEQARYYGFLLRIGQQLYLDYFPVQTHAQEGYEAFYKMNFVPMHSFYRLKQGADGKTITIGRFAENYLRTLIDKKKIRIKHEVKIDGLYVITAPTEELQQYVQKYSDVNEAYENNETYTRIK
jgi:hypothetical protein